MLIETIKNHPLGWREETLKMASLPGHTVDMPEVRALVAECRLINSRWIYGHDIVVRLRLPFVSSFVFPSYRSPPSAFARLGNQGRFWFHWVLKAVCKMVEKYLAPQVCGSISPHKRRLNRLIVN